MDINAIATTIAGAFVRRSTIPTTTSTDPSFDLNAGYATEAALAETRRAGGRRTVGLKVGFANKAVWRVMKLDTLLWAHMYDDTVHYAGSGTATLSVASMIQPKIEPEVVLKLRRPLDGPDALASVEWIAIGFEIIDCPYPDWKFQPPDFVAAYGLHAALVVGEPTPIAEMPEELAKFGEQLASLTVRLSRDGEQVAEGAGKNSLRSPALCLAELDAATKRRAGATQLGPGDLVSSGTLTEGQLIAAGQTWRVDVDGIDLKPLTLTLF